MKCQTVIDREREEEVIIYVHEKSKISEEIEAFVSSRSSELLGFDGKSASVVNIAEVFCFAVEENKVYAITENQKLRLKQRLYEIEETLGSDYVRINQSCIVNISKIQKFDASFSGSLSVILKNGYNDYVSRRQLKTVKERIGL